ncbi:MAG: amino acid permease [Gemmataceae bacterium]|nr:amino acid permease [Gemmataceae bacterium]
MTAPGRPSPASSSAESPGTMTRRLAQGAGVIIVSSVMFSFIGYWRTAAVVLCDLASTAYYIGAIVEQSIGPAAPWFILAVMCFSYMVRWVYIESCTLFVRGGVYRVVREAMGPLLAKIAVSALLFDYILTGPISSVTAGQYLIGLFLDLLKLAKLEVSANDPRVIPLKNWGSVLIACGVTIYFFWQNLKGIHESSEKALQIMMLTTIMGVVLILWCLLTLAVQGPPLRDEKRPELGRNAWPSPIPNIQPRINPSLSVPVLDEQGNPVKDKEGKAVTKDHEIDPTGFLHGTDMAKQLRGEKVKDEDGNDAVGPDNNKKYQRPPGFSWLSVIGVLGLFIAFGHSILAMSGEETLAQVYREVEAPKLQNFKKAAFVVFVYSLVLTAGVSFLAVLLIPDSQRLPEYSGNLLGGLAMNVIGPLWLRIILQAVVVVVGFLILSGAVNTAIIGSNGVLNRVAEDGVVPDWFLKPHPHYGTTYRLLYCILGMQLATIVLSQGDVFVLGEAYAFGVVWSFVFQALSMMVLRFTRPVRREFKVPLNIPIGGGKEIPVGLGIILVILLISAVMNLLTKEYATIFGLVFTALFFIAFTVSEHYNSHKLKGAKHEHVEQVTTKTSSEVTSESLGLTKHYRKLVSIRSVQNLFMLEKALAETDPETTSLVVMTAKVAPPGDPGASAAEAGAIDAYDRELMTAVVQRAELAGKEVRPLIVPTNNPLHAMLKTAMDLKANELVIGASNKYTADEQFEQVAFYWISLHGGNPAPLTVRVLSRERDMYLDLAGGNRIPKISERRARSVDELRAAGVGVDRVLVLHDGSPNHSDLFRAALTMLDDDVALGLVSIVPAGSDPHNGHGMVKTDEDQAQRLERPLTVHELKTGDGPEIVELAKRELYDVIILALPPETPNDPMGHLDERGRHIARHAHCRVLIATTPPIPHEVVDTTPSARP